MAAANDKQAAARGQDGQQAQVISFTKDPVLEDKRPRKIRSVRFGTMSGPDIMKSAEVRVSDRSLYRLPERKPAPFGVLDSHLGTTDKKGECETCRGKLQDCVGHFGYIRLELPVYHIGYLKAVLLILQCICKSCARILLNDDARWQFLRKFRRPRVEVLQRSGLVKRVAVLCKRAKICHYCGASNGTVKKLTGTLKLIHEKYGKDGSEAKEEVVRQMEAAIADNADIGNHANKIQDDITPLRALWLLQRMIPEDCELFDLHDPPEQLIVTHLAVPPVAIRPSVVMDAAAGSNEDDATMKLAVIIEVNNALQMGLQKGLPMANLMENWDFLQLQVGLYINSELPGLPLAAQPGKPMRGFVQRLKGKQGRFRQNLSGKRVDFSGRTVISPDPNLKITEVAVPQHMAQLLTFPERVSTHNIHRLRSRVINGVGKYPGANFVIYPDGNKWYLKYGDRRRVAAELKYGDVVERHLEDGDVVLFNRQPSLHRMSIMSHRARVMPWKTLRFNESVCNPYNADFDGDEMNLHVPQTEEARTEALLLMGVENNLCTPKNGDILVASTQDFLTSAFLLSRKDMFHDRASFSLLCSYMWDALVPVDLPTPAILKPVELWTGKQLFSVLVRPTAMDRVFVSLGVAEKTYTKEGGAFCRSDGFVMFRNSELLAGQLGKATLGNGSKQGLFATLNRQYSPAVAAVCMNRLAKLSARWIGSFGFSIGIDDVQPSHRLEAEKSKALERGYGASGAHIAAFNEGRLALQPGCNAAQTLEAEITGELNRIREEAGKVCMRELHYNNSALIMSQCGSKGSPINISQMVACVGQQSVGGKRAPNGFLHRSLPHFPRFDRSPQAKGFVANSFFSGLSPTEFVFHTMGGREGLVDTAVKTAETGYMSRRLMKALEDLSVAYDGSVRNASGGVVQMRYGDDGMDPANMEAGDGQPLSLEKVFTTCQALRPARNDPPLLPAELRAQIAARFATLEYTVVGGVEDEGEEGREEKGAKKEEEGGHGKVKVKAETKPAVAMNRGTTMGGGKSSSAAQQGGFAGGKLGGGGGGVGRGGDTGEGRQDVFEWGCSGKFKDSVADFLEQRIAAVEKARVRLGLPLDKLIVGRGTRAEAAERIVRQGVGRREEGTGGAKIEEVDGSHADVAGVDRGEGGEGGMSGRGAAVDSARGVANVEAAEEGALAAGEVKQSGEARARVKEEPVMSSDDVMMADVADERGGRGGNVKDTVKREGHEHGGKVVEGKKEEREEVVGTRKGERGEGGEGMKEEGGGEFECERLEGGVAEMIAKNVAGITAKQLKLFLDTCAERYEQKRMQPGTAVGAIGAQSIGEPGTQMTLKTFHFAGVASMNVTLGVPRIKEIINAAKTISTPIITVKLECDNDVKAARIVKGRIEKTTLGEVVRSIKTVLTSSVSMLSIKLDMQRIAALQLGVNANTVAAAILGASRLRLKLKPQHLRVVSHDKLLVYSPEADRHKLLFSLQSLRTQLPKVIVQGIPTVERAVINDVGGGKYNLLVEGTNFGAALGITGVDFARTTSNHVMEVEAVLGIEAARQSIIHEIKYTMGSHGMAIDPRHNMLLADVMTYKGEVLGITRFGIAKMKDSVLMLASFEKTTDHLFDAAVHGRKDEIEGVSECIIMGIPMPIGTGLFKIKQKVDHVPILPSKPPLLLMA